MRELLVATSDSVEQTRALAAAVAELARPGDLLLLVGDLGAGKTALARALIQTLAPGTRVKSPTYTLIESYDIGECQIHHLDLYRLRHPDELTELGLADLCGPRAVFLIEWPDKGGAETPALDLSLQLTRGEAERRTLDWVSFSPAGQALMERLVG